MKIAAAHRRLDNEWMRPIRAVTRSNGASSEQAVVALIEKHRIERIRATVRTERVRTAVLYFERRQEDDVARCLSMFNETCDDALRHLTRSAAGCRWAIANWEELQKMLDRRRDLVWRHTGSTAIQLQGFRRASTSSSFREPAFMTWLDCLVAQPNPKQKDIDRILDPRCVPKALQDRDVKLWPGNPAESRARLQAIVDRELPRLRALEETPPRPVRGPARAEAKDMALADSPGRSCRSSAPSGCTSSRMLQAVTALLKVRKQTAAARTAVVEREVEEVG